MDCEKCFAFKDGECEALEERYEKDCPFFKTPEQAADDAKKARIRLLSIPNGFEMWQRVNDTNAYYCRKRRENNETD